MIRVLVIAVVAFVLYRMMTDRSSRDAGSVKVPPSSPQQQNASPAGSVAPQIRTMIEQRLKPAAPVELRPGTAVAILVDTSGSMSGRVRAADGTNKTKIQIAQQAVLKLVQMTEQFAAEHPEKPTLLSVYEFSGRSSMPCRKVIPLGAPKLADAQPLIRAMRAEGDTPIGEAIIAARNDLDASGLGRLHILVVTDGENTYGLAPADVLNVMSGLSSTIGVYFVAFDVDARVFAPVKSAGAMVISASNEKELQETASGLFTSRILVE